MENTQNRITSELDAALPSNPPVFKPFLRHAVLIVVCILFFVISVFAAYKLGQEQSSLKKSAASSPSEQTIPTATVCGEDLKICENGQMVSADRKNCEFYACRATAHTCQTGYTPYVYSVGNIELCIPETWEPEHGETQVKRENYQLTFALGEYDKNQKLLVKPIFKITTNGVGFDNGAACLKKGELLKIGQRTFQTYEVFASQGDQLNHTCGSEVLHKTIEVPVKQELLFFSVGVEPLSVTDRTNALNELEEIVRKVVEEDSE